MAARPCGAPESFKEAVIKDRSTLSHHCKDLEPRLKDVPHTSEWKLVLHRLNDRSVAIIMPVHGGILFGVQKYSCQEIDHRTVQVVFRVDWHRPTDDFVVQWRGYNSRTPLTAER